MSRPEVNKITLFLAALLGLCLALLPFTPILKASQIKRVQSTETDVADVDMIVFQDLGIAVNADNSFMLIGFESSNYITMKVKGKVVEGGSGANIFTSYLEDSSTLNIARDRTEIVTSNVIGTVQSHIVEFDEGINIIKGRAAWAVDVSQRTVGLPESVNLTKSVIFIQTRGNIVAEDDHDAAKVRASFINSSAIELKRYRLPTTYLAGGVPVANSEYAVVEFDTDTKVTSKNVTMAYNSATATSALSGGDIISDIDKAFLVFSYSPGADVAGDAGQSNVRGEILNTTAVRFTRAEVGTTTNDTVDITYHVVELQDDCSFVQRNLTSSSALAYTATLGEAVTIARSVPIFSVSGGATALDFDATSTRANLTGTTTLSFDRMSAIATVASSFVVQFQPLTLKTPDGGEVWRVGEDHSINWTSSADIASDTIAIRLSDTNSTSLSDYDMYVSNETAANNTFLWTVPEEIGGTNLLGTNLRMAVVHQSLGSSRNYSLGHNKFTLTGSIDLLDPDGGETWYLGEGRLINWTRNGNLSSAPFNITISSDGGVGSWAVINNTANQSDVCVGNNCSYNWTVAGGTGPNMIIKVAWEGDPTDTYDQSAANFSIKGRLEIVQPNASTQWFTQENGTILWNKYGTWAGEEVELYYKVPGGSETEIELNVSTEEDNGTYEWIGIPNSAASGFTTVIIYSNQDPSVQVSNTSPEFELLPSINVTYPNTHQTWQVGDSPTITWDVNGPGIEKVHVWYNDSSGWVNITPGGAGGGWNASGGNWTWPSIPNWTVAEDIQLRVAKWDGSDVIPTVPYDDADSNVTIRGLLTVSNPSSGTVFAVGKNEYINWTVDGLGGSDLLRIAFSEAGDFSDRLNLTENQKATNLTWTWSGVPNNVTTSGKIRIEWQTNTSLYADSAGSFSIVPQVVLTAPDASAVYNISEFMVINWTPTGSVGRVRLNYTADDVTYNYSIKNSSGGDDFSESGPYNWTPIPDATMITEQFKIKVLSVNDPSNVSDVSNNTSAIRGLLDLTDPDDGSQVWQVGTQHYINWTRNGSQMGNITIKYSDNNGSLWNETINASIDSGSPFQVLWNVSDVMASAPSTRFDKMKVKIYRVADQTNTTDNSTEPFYIVPKITFTRPDVLNRTFYVDNIENVTWTTEGTLDKVNIYYSSDDGGNWSLAPGGQNKTNNGLFNWSVPNFIVDIFRLRIGSFWDNTTPEARDISVNFTIRPQIELVQPLGGESLKVGETYQIQWVNHITVGSVNITYSNDSGLGWTEINNSNEGTFFNWTVPDDMGNKSQIRIQSEFYADVNNTTSDFNITGSINLTAPTVGQSVFAHSNDTPIRWTYQGSKIGNVNIEYSNDSGYFWNTIEDDVSVTEGGAYEWVSPRVPDQTYDGTVKVRVYDVNNSATVGESGLFSIVGSIHLDSPNGGQNWAVGTSKYITWTSYGVSWVNVSYYNGSGWEDIFNDEPDGGKNVSWPIPSTLQVNNNAKFQVEDRANPTVSNDTSDAPLAIIGTFDITVPENNDIFIANESFYVNWTNNSNGVNNVTLDWSPTPATGNWTYLKTDGDNTVPNTGSYYWSPVPNGVTLGENCKMRVTDPANANASNQSEGVFRMRGRLTVTVPSGGEPWQVGTNHSINWTRKGEIASVEISYAPDGESFGPPITTQEADNLTWLWPIDWDETTGAAARVKVADASAPTSVFNLSAPFSVKGNYNLTKPSDAGILMTYDHGSSVYNITWDTFGTIPQTQLRYSTDGGDTFPAGNTITNVSGATEYYNWPIPDKIGYNLSIMVRDFDDPSVNNTSVNLFAINGSVLVNAPNDGSESWVVGTTHYVNWTPTGSYPWNVTIQYKNTSGGDWLGSYTNFSGANATLQTYTWTVPDDISDDVTVRVLTNTSNDTINASDTSNSTFKIKGEVLVTQPNGADLWYAEEYGLIKWNATGNVTPVLIQYSTDDSTWINISDDTAGTPGTNTYNWTPINDSLNSETVRIRITDNRSAFPEVNDTSNATFSIRPKINVTDPASGTDVFSNS
ncbi:MAG: hypothetical protein ABID09_01145, partial [Candidatus Omnitrophota bacterium]